MNADRLRLWECLHRMIYMEDPFGNILEIYSHSYELIYSEGAY